MTHDNDQASFTRPSRALIRLKERQHLRQQFIRHFLRNVVPRRHLPAADIARHATPFIECLEIFLDHTFRAPQHAQRASDLVAALDICPIVLKINRRRPK